MFMSNSVLGVISLLLVVLLGCQCDTIEDKVLYKDGNPKVVITKNCNDEILKYEHYTVDGELAFTLKYNNSNPQKPYEGRPWVHLIWGNTNPFIGDTINLEIDLVAPPEIEVEFSVEDDNGIAKLTKSDNYIYKVVANDTVENIKLKAVFLFKGEKWITAKRDLQLTCLPRSLINNNK